MYKFPDKGALFDSVDLDHEESKNKDKKGLGSSESSSEGSMIE